MSDTKDRTGKWRVRTGEHKRLDTGTLKAIDEAALLELTESAPVHDPYNKTIRPEGEPGVGATAKRRTLDDMRKLSETIRTKRLTK